MGTIRDVVPPGPGGVSELVHLLSTADGRSIQPLVAAMLAGWLAAMADIELPETSAEMIRSALTTIRADATALVVASIEAEARVAAAVNVPQPARFGAVFPRQRPDPLPSILDQVHPANRNDLTPTMLTANDEP